MRNVGLSTLTTISALRAMDAEPNVSHLSDLSKIEASAFYHFKTECEASGLLARPKYITSDDLCDGINDDVTLLSVRLSNPRVLFLLSISV